MKDYRYRRALHDRGVRSRRLRQHILYADDSPAFVTMEKLSMSEQRLFESCMRKRNYKDGCK